jgi:hypothetical protein
MFDSNIVQKDFIYQIGGSNSTRSGFAKIITSSAYREHLGFAALERTGVMMWRGSMAKMNSMGEKG